MLRLKFSWRRPHVALSMSLVLHIKTKPNTKLFKKKKKKASYCLKIPVYSVDCKNA